MSRSPSGPRAALDVLLCRGLERVRGAGPALVPEYSLDLRPRWGWDGAPPLAPLAERFEAKRGAYEDAIAGACDLLEWIGRIYVEQYVLAAWLLGGGAGFTVRFPCWWITNCSELGSRFDALWAAVENRFRRHGTSFWLERSAP